MVAKHPLELHGGPPGLGPHVLTDADLWKIVNWVIKCWVLFGVFVIPFAYKFIMLSSRVNGS